MVFSRKINMLFVTLAVSCMLSSGSAEAKKIITITNDDGGVVRDYVLRANLAKLRSDQIRMNGWCASACTAFLGNPTTCVTPRATFGFHGPTGGTQAQNRAAAETLARHFPKVLRDWYLTQAAQLQGQAYIVVTGEQLVQIGAAKWC